AQRFLQPGDRVEPEQQQRADPVADLEARQVTVGEGRLHPRIGRIDPGADHAHRPAREGEAGDRGVDPGKRRRLAQRLVGPAIDYRRAGNLRREDEPQLVKRAVVARHQRVGPYTPPSASYRLSSLSLRMISAWPRLSMPSS